MAAPRRVERLNSLLKEVLSEVIQHSLRNPALAKLFSVANVELTKDLSLAKVYISIIGDDAERKTTISILNKASGFIATLAAKQIVIKTFPRLIFKLDTTVDKQMHIQKLLNDVGFESTEA